MNTLAIVCGTCTAIFILWFFLEGHFITWWRIRKDSEEQESVDFDLDRMKEALKGPLIMMPHDMKSEDFRSWMAEQARIIRERRP